MWMNPLQVSFRCTDHNVLYLYARWETLNAIAIVDSQCSLKNWLMTSWTNNGIMSLMSSSPDMFSSKEAILTNIYTNTTDRDEQLEIIAKAGGNAECCVALLVPRNCAFDAMRERVPGVEKGPGYNRQGLALRPDRDIWVVNLNCDDIRELSPEKTDANDQDRKEHSQFREDSKNYERSSPQLPSSVERHPAESDTAVRLAASQALYRARERKMLERERLAVDPTYVRVDRSFIASHTEGRRPPPIGVQPPVASIQPSCAWDFRPVTSILRSWLVPVCAPCVVTSSEQGDHFIEVPSQVVLKRP